MILVAQQSDVLPRDHCLPNTLTLPPHPRPGRTRGPIAICTTGAAHIQPHISSTPWQYPSSIQENFPQENTPGNPRNLQTQQFR
ncbi:hypothetical protein PtA15_18A349 [Puccinia triticina]|uniref:Uncharacterized protein n=1 Tax=Puccinia triticina TaxID=208348 RepID=A0ABY7D6N4_9BASI|nr:uncharacterized protein PtA15_18A349 [Puccinia triticina]WAQ93289.1 hypothetical protein PtA15_18A349 [Puccinia triticina]